MGTLDNQLQRLTVEASKETLKDVKDSGSQPRAVPSGLPWEGPRSEKNEDVLHVIGSV